MNSVFDSIDHRPGADPGFLDRGGAKDFVHPAHIPSAKREVHYCRGQAPGSSVELDSLSCYLSLILKNSDTKLD